jgi:hypothetical protein
MPTENRSPAASHPATEVKRPYEAPRILFREPLEAVAALCAPTPPAKATRGACPLGPISS